MKKLLSFSLVLMMIYAVLSIPCLAMETASVDIGVDIENGGTAIIITEVNCPMPDKSRMVLEDGEKGSFHIDFSEEGEYSYLIQIEPDDREITFDDTIYNVKVYVNEKNGKLYTSIVIYNEKTGSKYAPSGVDDPCAVAFTNSFDPTITPPTIKPSEPTETQSSSEPESESSPSPSQSSEHPTSTKQPEGQNGSSGKSSNQPQTGDDSRLDHYLLLAIFASAGLFTLSICYYIYIDKQIKAKRNI